MGFFLRISQETGCVRVVEHPDLVAEAGGSKRLADWLAWSKAGDVYHVVQSGVMYVRLGVVTVAG